MYLTSKKNVKAAIPAVRNDTSEKVVSRKYKNEDDMTTHELSRCCREKGEDKMLGRCEEKRKMVKRIKPTWGTLCA